MLQEGVKPNHCYPYLSQYWHGICKKKKKKKVIEEQISQTNVLSYSSDTHGKRERSPDTGAAVLCIHLRGFLWQVISMYTYRILR